MSEANQEEYKLKYNIDRGKMKKKKNMRGLERL